MQFSRSTRMGAAALGAGVIAVGAVGAGASVAASVPAAGQKTVTATLISRGPRTLAPGTTVRPSNLVGQRVFTDAGHGFALASVGQAQYPAATSNGGRTWTTNGPALHLDAAQAPFAVTDIGAASQRTVFAYGSGQVIDTTGDGGKHWYRALFNGEPMAVVRNAQGHLVAFVDGETNGGATWQYVSKNGGRTWRYDTTVGGS